MTGRSFQRTCQYFEDIYFVLFVRPPASCESVVRRLNEVLQISLYTMYKCIGNFFVNEFDMYLLKVIVNIEREFQISFNWTFIHIIQA